jgi:cytochrome c oxidase assembly factor CtaG
MSWRPSLPVAATLLAAAGLYAWGMARVRRRHPARPWPLARAAAFLGGLAVIGIALMSAVAVYDTTFFWVHMIQHLLLIMVAPALLVAGRPLILAMHATRNPVHHRLKRLLRSRPVTIATSPPLAIALYTAVVVGTHLTSFNNLVITNHGVQVGEQFGYVVAGYLYFLPGFGHEPIRWHLSYPGKMLLLLLVMPIDTFTGVALLMTTHAPWPAYATQPRTWGPDLLTDVHWGGAVMWVGSDTIMIILLVAVIFPWLTGARRTGTRLRWIEQARRATLDRYVATAATLPTDASTSGTSTSGSTGASGGNSISGEDIDEDQARLDSYNAWLAQIASRDPRQR